MKHLFILLILLLVMPASSNGQTLENHAWNVRSIPSDELKGTKADTMYIYVEEGMGYFAYQHNNKSEYAIKCDNGNLFDVHANPWSFPAGSIDVNAIIGLYDNNDKLVDKLEDKLDVGKVHNIASTRKKHKGIAKKIIDWIESGKGYVRIVAPRLGKSSFDIKVPKR